LGNLSSPRAGRTGRTVYQFHTRTKTGRAPQPDAAAPDAWVELHAEDAEPLGRIRPGTVFVPFHYGAWRHAGKVPRAANELTITAWDPVSKQPIFKVAAVRLAKVREG